MEEIESILNIVDGLILKGSEDELLMGAYRKVHQSGLKVKEVLESKKRSAAEAGLSAETEPASKKCFVESDGIRVEQPSLTDEEQRQMCVNKYHDRTYHGEDYLVTTDEQYAAQTKALSEKYGWKPEVHYSDCAENRNVPASKETFQELFDVVMKYGRVTVDTTHPMPVWRELYVTARKFWHVFVADKTFYERFKAFVYATRPEVEFMDWYVWNDCRFKVTFCEKAPEGQKILSREQFKAKQAKANDADAENKK